MRSGWYPRHAWIAEKQDGLVVLGPIELGFYLVSEKKKKKKSACRDKSL